MSVTFTGKSVQYGGLTFFVQQGLIVCEDNRDVPGGRGSRTTMTPSQLVERIGHLGHMLQRLRGCEQSNIERDENPRLLRRFNDLEELAQIAHDMGDPSDPEYQAFRRKHRPGHKAKVSLRAGSDAAGYPALPAMQLGRFTGRTAEPDRVLASGGAGANLSGGIVLHQPPRRRSAAGLVLPNL